ncbi:MAG: apolipoprotein N-acyltransferase [Proteobacteria bacterium]|nr:apolipoprotein N-acyltransferase [Pseudomonadota bacterium]
MIPILMAPLSGALYAFAFPNFLNTGWFFLSPVALLLMSWCLEKIPSTRKRIVAVLLHQTGFNLTGFYWVPATLQEFGGLPPAVSHFIALFLALVLNPQWWGWLVWLKYRDRIPGFKTWTLDMRSLYGAILLTGVEILIPQQFPVFAGHVWMQFDQWLQLAPIGGVSLYSFFTWWLVLTLQQSLTRRTFSVAPLVLCFIFFLLHLVLPKWEINDAKQSLNIRVVQANVGNFLKIESESGVPRAIEDVIQRYQELSLKENPQELDLLIWPETAYPFSMSSPQFKNRDKTPPALFTDIVAQTGSEILLGGYDNNGGDRSWMDRFETEYNAAFHIGTQGEFKQVYRKHILIPFGETMPFGPFNKTLSAWVPGVSFFAAGTDFPIFTTRKGARFVTPICYEILQPRFVADLLNRPSHPADFIVNLTNDSWYGKTAEPFQHLFLAKWRAVEFRRPIVRSTNTGITTVIYPNGIEGRRLYTGEKDVLDVKLELPLTPPTTIYQIWGYLPLIGLWLVLALGFTSFWWLKILLAKDRVNAAHP